MGRIFTRDRAVRAEAPVGRALVSTVMVAAVFAAAVFGCDHGRPAAVDAPAGRRSATEGTYETVVVCPRSDPYYDLARRISAEENLPMVDEVAGAFDLAPTFVIVVAAPRNLPAERLSAIGRMYRSRDYYPAVGIITGSTMDLAARLWERRDSVERGAHFVAGDVDILQGIYEPTIYEVSEGVAATKLNRENLIDVLRRADYLYWTRHSGPRSWSWNEDSPDRGDKDQLRPADIPALGPVVIYSLTCSPFRPWLEDSIALGFVDNGAAAFLGFLNTPHTDAFMRHRWTAPGILSWRDMPLGIVAQVQNRTATRVIFRSPQLFMLGDPRIYLSPDRPYDVVADTIQEDGSRSIAGRSEQTGILAVRVNDGARYGFVSVEGVAAVSETDAFYNHRLQTLDLGDDKYLLFTHAGGEFQIDLRRNAPAGRPVAGALVDALDFSWAALWLSTYADGNPHLQVVSLPLLVGILLLKALRRRKPIRTYKPVFFVSLMVALLRSVYFLLRRNGFPSAPTWRAILPSESPSASSACLPPLRRA